jgi:hypothetical protein
MSPIQKVVLEYGWQLRKIKGPSALYAGMLRHFGLLEEAEQVKLTEEKLLDLAYKIYIHKRCKIDPNFIP